MMCTEIKLNKLVRLLERQGFRDVVPTILEEGLHLFSWSGKDIYKFAKSFHLMFYQILKAEDELLMTTTKRNGDVFAIFKEFYFMIIQIEEESQDEVWKQVKESIDGNLYAKKCKEMKPIKEAFRRSLENKEPNF
ncbi:unnamed protein product [Cylicocyclus nassatus]|uniref:Uncharacterized protein n=1 Tax=Cylicocyclus nassatus TaxID=53992 RepID=A0AA36DW46_CYLNA|nr:unnamed protein product [Cylicocyclus nassatus]